MAINAQNLAAAMQANDQVRRSTQLPLFFGRKDKDTVTPQMLLDRIDVAGAVAPWDNARKRNEFYLILRDRALMWYNSLTDTDVDRDNWDQLRAEFLASYEPKGTARTTCANFADLVQRQGETVMDYYLRVHESYQKLIDTKPAAIANVRDAAAAAGAHDAAAVKKEGVRDMEKFFKHQLFLAGLKDDMRAKVMEAGKDTLHESMRYATEIEVIHNDKKKISAIGPKVAAISSHDDNDDDVNVDDLEDDEIEAINAIRTRNGRPPFQRRFGNRFQKQGRRDFSKVVCRYCKKTGHLQHSCNARKAAGAPLVDAQGKALPKRVAAISENSPSGSRASGNQQASSPSPPSSSHNVGAITATSINHLNW